MNNFWVLRVMDIQNISGIIEGLGLRCDICKLLHTGLHLIYLDLIPCSSTQKENHE